MNTASTRLLPAPRVLCAALLLAAPWGAMAADARDAAGNRWEALIEQPGTAPPTTPESGDPDIAQPVSPLFCTGDRAWCVRLIASRNTPQPSLQVQEFVPGEDGPRDRHVGYTGPERDGQFQVWPYIRLAPGLGAPSVPTDPVQAAFENVVVGVVVEQSTGYAGGGASNGTLLLETIYHTDEGVESSSVLSLPVAGQASIRACFSEQDTALRKGACHDEYTFSAALSLLPQGRDMPLLRYASTATRFPAFVSRNRDSLAKGALTDRDLRTARDPACSVERTLRYVSGRYVAEPALPDCSEFTGL
ncbi:hypothetical protein ACLB90_00890 [Stenotrophomonas sp. LGBM10]|uniref:hypothetical protein n=1 Tax=Stenotrophomonas sp. LGBM10 TaxID=3390038 RepID=UPI00398B8473